MNKKFKVLSIAIVALLAMSVTTALPSSAASSALPKTVSSGDFKWTFKSLKCGIRKLGGSYINTTADGQFCILYASAKNMTKKSHYLNDSDVMLVDSSGNEFEPNSGMTMYMDCVFFLNKVSASNTKNGCLVYDVNKSSKIKKILISGGWFDDDVVIKL
jgi:hypothetical protein